MYSIGKATAAALLPILTTARTCTATITGLTPGTSYQAQVRAHNPEGWSEWSALGTGSTSANQRPEFTDGSSATRRMDENTTGVQNIGDPISATDPESTTLTYSLEGHDTQMSSPSSRAAVSFGLILEKPTTMRRSPAIL